MVIFNSYVKLPEGIKHCRHPSFRWKLAKFQDLFANTYVHQAQRERSRKMHLAYTCGLADKVFSIPRQRILLKNLKNCCDEELRWKMALGKCSCINFKNLQNQLLAEVKLPIWQLLPVTAAWKSTKDCSM